MKIDYTGETGWPIFIDLDQNALRPDKPLVPRDATIAFVRDPKTDMFLGLKWKKVDWDTMVTGGIEDGDTALETALKEILQETGYRNLRLVAELPRWSSLFFHSPKDENRYATWTSYFFELVDDEQDPISAEELEKHEPVWLTREQMEEFRLPEGPRWLWEQVEERGL